MADNIAITPGSGATVSTEEITTLNGGGVSAQHVQRVLLTARTADGVAVDLAVDATSGEQRVLLAFDTLRIAVTSAGLTTGTTAYVTGDVLGTLFTLANAARTSGGSGRIRSVVLVDELDITNAIDVFYFRGSVTFGTDNSAPSISDADALQLVAVVPLVNMLDLGGVRVNSAHNLSIPYDCDSGTSLYAGLVTRSGHTFFTGSATAIKLITLVERD